jgi:hypothetical protein
MDMALSPGSFIIIKNYKNCASCFSELDMYFDKILSVSQKRNYYAISLMEKHNDPIWYVKENGRLMKHISANYFLCYNGRVADTAYLLPSLCISNEDITPMVLLCDSKKIYVFKYKDIFDGYGQLSTTFTKTVKKIANNTAGRNL